MKADVDGTPTEQFRARAGWVSATQAASVAPPGQRCGTCINLGQPADTDNGRRAALAKLHIGKKELGLDDDTWRAMVRRVSYGRTTSSADLKDLERDALLRELKVAGFRPQIKPKPRPVQQAIAASSKEALAGKVRALLLDAGRDDAYANSIAARRFDVLRWEWLPYVELRKLVQMLVIDAQRRQRRLEAAQ